MPNYFCEAMMIQLDLGNEQRQILLEVMETALSDLRMEIADTDSMNYREMLKGRKEVIKKVIVALQAAPAESPADDERSLGQNSVGGDREQPRVP